MRLSTRRYFWAYLFIAPNLAIFAVFMLLPVILAFLLAFKEFSILRFDTWTDWKNFFLQDYVGWRNFWDALYNPVFAIALRNTLFYTVVMVPGSVILSLILAALITPLNEKAQTFFRSAYYLPGMTSAVIISLVWRWMFEPESGLLNLILGVFSIQGLDWLGSPDTALRSIILTGLVYAPGFGVILYTASINRIPEELHDAARIDGASSLQRWLYVVVPLLKPTTLYLTVMNTIWSFQVFTNIYIMTRGGPGDSTTTLVYHIYDLAFSQVGRKGEAAAVSLILFILVAAFAAIQFRLMRSEMEY